MDEQNPYEGAKSMYLVDDVDNVDNLKISIIQFPIIFFFSYLILL